MDNKNKNPNVPNLRFNDHDTWIENSLQNVTSYFKSGKNINAKMILEEGLYPVYGGNGIRGFTNTYNQDGKYILVGRQGALCGNVRLVEGKSYVTEHGIIIINNNQSTIEYLKPLLEHMHLEKESDQSAQPGLAVNKLLLLKQYFPSIENQERIGKLFTLLEMKIQLQNKIIEDYSLLKDSIIHQTFSMDYTKVKLSALLTEVSVRNKEEHINNVLSVSNKLGFIKQSEQFEDREVASNDTSNYKIVSKGDYAYNPARINVGSIARLIHYDKGIISPMYSCFRIDLNKITYTYFDMFLNSSSFNRQLNKRLEGSVRQCLTFEGMLSMSIELPPIEIQKSISDKIDMLNDIIKIEIDYRTALIKQKQYLLNNLFI